MYVCNKVSYTKVCIMYALLSKLISIVPRWYVIIMSRFARFFGLEEAPTRAIRFAKILAVLNPTYAMTFSISTTFWLIFIAEQLGGGDYVAGLAKVGILVVIQLGLQTLLDYPTGALGDHIGQKYVIASAMFCYALMFWLSSAVTPMSPYPIFVAIYALFGIALSQESGAWDAWFDTNFREAYPNDEGRKQYGVFQGKLGMLFGLANTIVLIPGSWLAYTLGRTWVFQLQAVAYIILAIIVLRFLNDLPEVQEKRQESRDEGNYIALLREGARFMISDSFIIYIMAGQILMAAVGMVYGSLILFPFYYLYLISDIATASFRTFMYVPQVPLQDRSGIWAMKFEPSKWIPRFRLLQIGSTFPLLIMAGLLILLPPPLDATNLLQLTWPGSSFVLLEVPVESIPALVVVFILFVFGFLMGTFGGILTQRVLIDVIPNKIRNSVYSLQPTLIMITSIPLMLASGEMLSNIGFPTTFLILSAISLFGVILIRKSFNYPIPTSVSTPQDYPGEQVEIIEGTPEEIE